MTPCWTPQGSRQGLAELSSSSSGALVARGGPDVRLLHERVGNKADAQDLSRALGDIAALKQALGPAYLTTQGAGLPSWPGGVAWGGRQLSGAARHQRHGCSPALHVRSMGGAGWCHASVHRGRAAVPPS